MASVLALLVAVLALAAGASAKKHAAEPKIVQLPRDIAHYLDNFRHTSDPVMRGHVARRLGLLEGINYAQKSVACSATTIGAVGGTAAVAGSAITAQTACSNYVWNSATGAVATGGRTSSGWQPGANIDPIYGSAFPVSSAVTTPNTLQVAAGIVPATAAAAAAYVLPTSYTGQVGQVLATQTAWGGGPAGTILSAPAGAFVWGVHSTPSTSSVASGSASQLISWFLGAPAANVSVSGVGYGSANSQGKFAAGTAGAGGYTLVGAAGTTTAVLGSLVNTPAPGAFIPKGVTFAATVLIGTSATSLTTATIAGLTCIQYLRVHSDVNYLSPYVCHATITGLTTNTVYYYTISTVVSGTPAVGPAAGTYITPTATYSSTATAWKFTTIPTASGTTALMATAYPFNMVVMADVGQTFNSSLTAQYISTYMLGTNAHAVLNVGDYTYGDDYGIYSTYYDGGSGSNPWKFDSWAPMWQSVLGQAAILNVAGNHEIESLPTQAYNNALSTDTATSYSFFASDQRYPYQAWAARYPNGAATPSTYGDLWTSQFYSQNLGPVHFIVLNSYIPFVSGTAQYTFLAADLAAINRVNTPWVVISFHVPMYHTYLTHYKEAECFRSQYEALFYTYKVDFVINGHVHAYERTHAMYNYAPDACGPVYITIGDGGNIEGPYRNFMDEVIPSSGGVTYCQAASAGTIKSGVSLTGTWSPSYQLAAQPTTCTTLTFQPPAPYTTAGILANPYNSAQYWCQSVQPPWSAYRDPSFGFASLIFTSDTTANWAWYRNVDQNVGSNSANLVSVDKTSYTRYTGSCASGGAVAGSAQSDPAYANSFVAPAYCGSSATTGYSALYYQICLTVVQDALVGSNCAFIAGTTGAASATAVYTAIAAAYTALSSANQAAITADVGFLGIAYNVSAILGIKSSLLPTEITTFQTAFLVAIKSTCVAVASPPPPPVTIVTVPGSTTATTTTGATVNQVTGNIVWAICASAATTTFKTSVLSSLQTTSGCASCTVTVVYTSTCRRRQLLQTGTTTGAFTVAGFSSAASAATFATAANSGTVASVISQATGVSATVSGASATTTTTSAASAVSAAGSLLAVLVAAVASLYL